jgi:hypothetical protein
MASAVLAKNERVIKMKTYYVTNSQGIVRVIVDASNEQDALDAAKILLNGPLVIQKVI